MPQTLQRAEGLTGPEKVSRRCVFSGAIKDWEDLVSGVDARRFLRRKSANIHVRKRRSPSLDLLV